MNKKNMITKLVLVSVFLAALFTLGNASAGGLGGDLINIVAPGVGTQLDEIHRQIKEANPSYSKQEEQFTNDVRKGMGLKPHCEPLYNKYGEQVDCR